LTWATTMWRTLALNTLATGMNGTASMVFVSFTTGTAIAYMIRNVAPTET